MTESEHPGASPASDHPLRRTQLAVNGNKIAYYVNVDPEHASVQVFTEPDWYLGTSWLGPSHDHFETTNRKPNLSTFLLWKR
jgi:hypothetical protein